MLSNKQLEKVFGVPVIKEVVDIDINKMYGFAICSDITPEWRCQIGGYLRLMGMREGNFRMWVNFSELQLEDEPYLNTALFEVKKVKDEYELVGILTKIRTNKKINLLMYGSYCDPETIDDEVALVKKGTYPEFEWDNYYY